MPFWRRDKPTDEPHPADTPQDWAESESWRGWEPPLAVVRGESFRQHELRALAGGPRKNGWLVPVEARLIREPTNPHDRHAVRVEVDGRHVGYIAREVARHLSPFMRKQGLEELRVPGVIRGGRRATGGNLSLGVHLWLHRRLQPGPELPFDEAARAAYRVPWPPDEDEGREAQRGRPREPGCVFEDPSGKRCGRKPAEPVDLGGVRVRLCAQHRP